MCEMALSWSAVDLGTAALLNAWQKWAVMQFDIEQLSLCFIQIIDEHRWCRIPYGLGNVW